MISQFRKATVLLAFIAIPSVYYLLFTNNDASPGKSYVYGNQEKITMWRNYMSNIVETSPKKRYPDAIIIGAEKCGTTALVWFLREHPLIKTPAHPEQFFFNRAHYKDNLEKYLERMPEVQDHQLVMEKTPRYFKSRVSVDSIRETLPDAKIILILCDPVNRTYSDFLQCAAKGQINSGQDFDEYIQDFVRDYGDSFQNQSDEVLYHKLTTRLLSIARPHILTTGLYYYYVKKWLKHYELGSNFLILDGEEFLREPWKGIERVQDFLGIPKLITEEDFKQLPSGFFSIRKWSADADGEYVSMRSSKGRSRLQSKNWDPKPLREYFHNANEKLFNLIGERFDWQ